MKELLNKDITLKAFSIFLALFMWLYVVNIENPETEVTIKDIPVEFSGLDKIDERGLIMMNKEEQTVALKLKGRRKTLTSLNNKNIKAVAELGTLEEVGEHSPIILVTLPIENIEIIEKRPYNANVQLDKMLEVQKEVKVVSKGVPKDPYVTLPPTVTPNVITIKAPSSIINTINKVQVMIDVSNSTKDIVAKSEYKVYDNNNEIIDDSKFIRQVDNVEIVYPIRKTKKVSIEPQVVGTPAKDYIVSDIVVIPNTVDIVGETNIIDSTTKVLTERINVDNIDNNIEMDIPIQLNEGVMLKGTRDTAKIIINVEKQITRTIETKTIKVQNVPEELSYRLITKTLTVTLKGTESKMEEIIKNGVYAFVDINNLSEGEHDVPVELLLEDDVEAVDAYVATVKLSKQATEVDKIDEENDISSQEDNRL